LHGPRRRRVRPNISAKSRVTNSTMERYRFDDFIEYTLSKRGRENVALTLLAASCVAGIVVIGRL
jgi:hypothetical protein